MATILPGSPPGFDRNNVAGTMRSICGYLRNMHDNINFQFGQLQKTQDAQGGKVETLEKKVSALEDSLRAAQEEIGTLKTNYTKLEARVALLEQKN